LEHPFYINGSNLNVQYFRFAVCTPIRKDDKEGWKSLKSTIYRLEKKEMVQTAFKNSKNYIRLSADDLFNAEIYKTKQA
jgi:hypothetical protein